MRRIWALTWFLVRDLFLSLAGILPLAVALAFGIIAFEYGMDQAQFITVAGVGTGAICLLTTLLLASRANRASSYLLVARLHRRAELLVALMLGGWGVTAVLTMLLTAANLLAGRLTLNFPSALWIAPTWLVFWLMAAALALPLSALVGRAGSHLIAWLLVAAVLLANDRKEKLQSLGLDWVVRAVTTLLWPVSTLLSRASSGVHDHIFFLAWALTLVYALLLFGLAAQIFEEKDLLWSE